MATRLPLRLALASFLCLQGPAAADTDAADKNKTAPASEDIWKRENLTGDWGGLRKRLEDAGVTFSANEVSEGWANLTGGLRRGATYNGGQPDLPQCQLRVS